MKPFIIKLANDSHISYAQEICDEMESSSKIRGTGIAKRSPEYIAQKMRQGNAIIAFSQDIQWAGFCYIETWQSGEYVANSGLIIAPSFRNQGLAKSIKERIFDLSQTNFPNAKIFGLTTGLAVMKINSDLGYVPVTYSELTNDEQFWQGCKSCVNYSILASKAYKNCLCTAMLYCLEDQKLIVQTPVITNGETDFESSKLLSILKRLTRLKKSVFLKKIESK